MGPKDTETREMSYQLDQHEDRQGMRIRAGLRESSWRSPEGVEGAIGRWDPR